MRKPFLLCTLMLIQAILLLTGQVGIAQDRISAAQRIPADTLLYFSVPDVEQFGEQWSKSSMGQITHDEAFADMKKDLVKLIEKYSQKFEEETDLSLDQVMGIPSREISLAFVKTSDGKLGGVAFMDYGESGEILEKILTKTADALDKQGAQRSINSAEGTKITVYSFGDDGADAGPVKVPLAKKFAYFLKEKTLVVSNDDKILESVLSMWDGQNQDSLANKKEYQYIQQKCSEPGAPAVMQWYMNPIGTLQTVLGIASRANPQVAMVQGFLPALGITNLKAVGGTSYLATEDFDSISRTFTFVELPTSGIISMFKCPAVAQQPPEWVSDKVSSYYSINWGIESAYDSIETLFDGFQGRPGALAAIVDQLADKPDGPKIHIKKDIVDNLSGRVQVATEIIDGEQIDLTKLSGQFTVALGLKNSDAFQKIISSLTARDDFPGQAREFQGTTLYEIPGAVLNTPTDAAFCIAENQLFVANDVKQIERVLRKDRGVGSLLNSADYKRISETFPEKTSIITYQNSDAQIHALYEMLLKNRSAVDIEGVDLEKMPSFEVIQKYLPISGGYTVPDDQGFLTSTFTVKKSSR
ncbi:hypothetical protein [Gimesia aquarii]|uniref:DUF3352 domain-containing protein n=1 Tax=Gimesia aquarii TaxID=2527964 RepID=A0A517X0U8_9PLAN|nr:hypothetical protein [Gimesia aquarii]QDU11124.1 hypothetical protein V202x_45400 [Gimesia aquarii]